jgi:hypothetical protein
MSRPDIEALGQSTLELVFIPNLDNSAIALLMAACRRRASAFEVRGLAS